MKTIPARSSASAISSGVSSMATPRASSTSALPQRDVTERLPCLATGTPAPATTKAAAVEMLKVVTEPPPVPAVSTSREESADRTARMADRSALTPPATSDGATPFARSPMRRPAIWTSEAEPSMKRAKAPSACSAVRWWPSATSSSTGVRAVSSRSGVGAAGCVCAVGAAARASGVGAGGRASGVGLACSIMESCGVGGHRGTDARSPADPLPRPATGVRPEA